MSLARVTRVNRAMKEQGVCGHGGCTTLIRKGDPYLWFKVGFRSRYKHVRCVDHFPRQSDRESSLVASVYVAQEDFGDQLASLESVEDIRDAIAAVADAAREVAGEYDTAATDDNGTEWNTTAVERRDQIESAADDLESWEPGSDEPERCELHEDDDDPESEDVEACPDCGQNRDEWLEAVRSSAQEAVDGMDLP